MGILTEDLELRGTVSMTGNFYPPSGSIKNTHIGAASSDAIVATKLEHQFPVKSSLWSNSTDMIVSGDELLHIVGGLTGEIVRLEACQVTPTTSTANTVTVDLHRSSSGGAFATVLSATIAFGSTTTARTAYAGTLSAVDLVDGDILKLVVTAAGSTLTQARGMLATVFLREDPQ